MAENLVKINLLGKFSVSSGGIKVDSKDISNQLCTLLSYLTVNVGRNIPFEEISGVLWSSEVANSSGALKNLVYRLRKVLENKKFPYYRELIVSNQGSYRLNPRLNFEVDTTEFVRIFDKAMAETRPDKKEQLLSKVVKIYGGDFMSVMPGQPWTFELCQKLHKMYLEAAYIQLEILFQGEKYENMLTLARQAVAIDRFDETAHKYVMLGLYKTGMTHKALIYYKNTRELFYRELGIELSETTREFYNEISKSSKVINVDILELEEEFTENKDESKDTFYCELEVFKQIYRFTTRVLGRMGTSFFMMLITTSSPDGGELETRAREKSMEHLYKAIQSSLRRGDVFSRCSPSQYVLLLPSLSFENGGEIVDRITRKFKLSCPSRKIGITHNIQTIQSLEN